jgi:hypothetical protein
MKTLELIPSISSSSHPLVRLLISDSVFPISLLADSGVFDPSLIGTLQGLGAPIRHQREKGWLTMSLVFSYSLLPEVAACQMWQEMARCICSMARRSCSVSRRQWPTAVLKVSDGGGKPYPLFSGSCVTNGMRQQQGK